MGPSGNKKRQNTRPNGRPFGGEPVRHTGVAVGDDDAERAVVVGHGLRPVEADRTPQVVERLPGRCDHAVTGVTADEISSFRTSSPVHRHP
jgi:hypothetical protein